MYNILSIGRASMIVMPCFCLVFHLVFLPLLLGDMLECSILYKSPSYQTRKQGTCHDAMAFAHIVPLHLSMASPSPCIEEVGHFGCTFQ